MRTTLISILLLGLAAGLAWWAFGTEAPAPRAIEPGTTPARTQPGPDPAGAREELDGPERADATPSERTAAGPVARAEEPPAEASPVAARRSIDEPEHDTRGFVVLTVLDTAGTAVEGAQVVVEHLQTASGRTTQYGWSDPSARARTDEDGGARVGYPAWVGDLELTGAVAFSITHPEFLTYRGRCLVESGGGTVTLERGGRVIVSGWIADPDNTVTAVEPRLTDGADVQPDEWVRTQDGRPSTTGIPPGRHGLALSHVAADGVRYESDLLLFELADVEVKELALELRPALSLEGRLASEVPRPVTSGAVLIALHTGGRRGEPSMLVTREGEVFEDGSFRIEGLPPSQGEIIAVCDGWVSAQVPTRDLERLGVTRVDEDTIAEAQRRLGRRALGLREVDVRVDEQPIVLAMERSGTARVSVLGPDERPLVGASVAVLPQVRWKSGHTLPFMLREAAGTTDASGTCTIPNLPQGLHDVRVLHEGLVMPELERRIGRARRMGEVELKPGDETALVLRMEPPG